MNITTASAENISEVVFMKKDKGRKEVKNSKKIIDLTSYISPDMLQSDTNGSYTGTTKDAYYGEDNDKPVQDADDL